MRRVRRSIGGARAVATLPLVLLVTACATGGQCELAQVATLPVLTARGIPVVRAQLNGTPVAFMVDSGAFASTVATDVATRLDLPVEDDQRRIFVGIGGDVVVYRTVVHRLGLGGAEARNAVFWRADDPHGTVAGLPLGGLFGADFLVNYDVLLDLPERRIVLYQERKCDGDIVPPLPDPAFVLPFSVDAGHHAVVEARVDDHPFSAVLDTGADVTAIGLDDARAAGVTPTMLKADLAFKDVGVDGRQVDANIHEFGSLAVGGEVRRPARIEVSDIQTGAVVGEDFFRRNQVWLFYGRGKAYVHPIGPVTVVPSPGASKADTAAR